MGSSARGRLIDSDQLGQRAMEDETVRNRIRAERIRAGENADKNELRDGLCLFTGPYDAARDGCDGPCAAGRTLGRSIRRKSNTTTTENNIDE